MVDVSDTARALARGVRTTLIAAAVSAVLIAAYGTSTCAAETPRWRYAPAEVPPPPEGVEVAKPSYGVPVGVVGEMSFWAPNRGLMIIGGTEADGGPVASGVYAYDGASWHQLATVCGGAEGRIVWAGPDEFWTIANQRAGQRLGNEGEEREESAVSLCRFADGKVAGSYAVPLEEKESWRHMTGGACYTPSNCWFGGVNGKAPNKGAFHLHWNGNALVVDYEPEDHAVTSQALFGGVIFEAVQLGSADEWLSEGERKRPAVVHTVAPIEAEEAFQDFTIYSSADKRLPEYGEKVAPEALQGFDLAVNAPADEQGTQLWAAANPSNQRPTSSSLASLTVLRAVAGEGALSGTEASWTQVLPGSGGVSSLMGEALAGAKTEIGSSSEWGVNGALAPEPGSEDAWLSLREPSKPEPGEEKGARVVQLQADGQIAQKDALPETDEPIGFRGSAGPIACPAANDCWLATFAEPASKAGWLFHYTDGAPEAQNTDPFFDGADGVITYRPPDAGVPVVYPDGFAEDDSLLYQQVIPASTPRQEPVVKHTKGGKPRPLVKHVKSKLVRHQTLIIVFTLTAKAHVQLIARRNKAVVGRTKRETLKPGRHEISIALDPRRWPTKLQFEAKPAKGVGGLQPEASEGSGSQGAEANVVGT